MTLPDRVRGIARKLRDVPRATIIDPMEAVRFHAATARELDDLAAEMAPDERPLNPRTSRPGERRRRVMVRQRVVAVESRGA